MLFMFYLFILFVKTDIFVFIFFSAEQKKQVIFL